MGTLQSAGIFIVSAVAATGLATGCSAKPQPPACFEESSHQDRVAIMDAETEQFLRDYGYEPTSECGQNAPPAVAFTVRIGTCTGMYAYDPETGEYHIFRVGNGQGLDTFVSTPTRADIPTVDELTLNHPRYTDCKQ